MDLDLPLLSGERVLWTRSAWNGWRAFLRGHSPLWVLGLALLAAAELAPAVRDRLRGEPPPWTLGWRHLAAGLVLVAVALEVVPRALEQRRTVFVVTSMRAGVVGPGRATWLRDPPTPAVTALPGGRARCAWSVDPPLSFDVPADEVVGLLAALERSA